MAKMFACGDVVNYQNQDGLICSSQLQEVIQSADYAVCNFEAPIAGHGIPQPKSGPHHSQQGTTLDGLKKHGFDLALLANNHIMDYGVDGLSATKERATLAGLDTVGAGLTIEDAYAPLIRNVEGLSVGMINACEAQFGVIDYFNRKESAGYAWLNHALIDKSILSLKKQCDFVAVFAHAGLENYSIPQKEWRERYRHLCDLGADIVIGAHPHAPQGYERHNGSLIFYSLGNFYFDGGRWANSENRSYAVMIELNKGQSPTFTAIPHYTRNGKVDLAPKEKQVNIEALCLSLGKEYEQAHTEMVLQAFRGVNRNLIRSFSTVPSGETLWSTLKEISAVLSGRRRSMNRHLLSLHLLRNEAYYYVARNALELRAAKQFSHE